MGFWDFFRKEPDVTVDSLTEACQGFLENFKILSENCNTIKAHLEGDIVIFTKNYNETVKELADSHEATLSAIDSDISKLDANIQIADKITSFFEG